MKIEKPVLAKFLKKVKMEGGQQIMECLLEFKDDGLYINAMAGANVTGVFAKLKKEAFKEYKAIGKVVLTDLKTDLKIIDRLSGEITLIKEGNMLTVKADKKWELPLMAEDFFKKELNEPNLEHENMFKLSAKELNDIFTDYSLCGGDARFIIKTEQDKVIFTNTGTYKYTTEFHREGIKPGTQVKFAKPIVDALSNLDSDLEIYIASDFPIKVIEKTDKSDICIIIAPVVNED